MTVHAPTGNMRVVYAEAKIILMSSIVEEAWGRIASEAQFSGIPVIASDHGGLSEAGGPGGVLPDPEGRVEAWAGALRAQWSGDAACAELPAGALARSVQSCLDPQVQIDALMRAARRSIAVKARAADPAETMAVMDGLQPRVLVAGN